MGNLLINPITGEFDFVGSGGSGPTPPQGLTWSEKVADFNAEVENAYFCNAGLTVTLPDTAGLVLGDTIIVYVDTTGSVVVQANTGQSIQVGSAVSASGGTSTCPVNEKGSILELIFKPSDFTWHTQSSLGTWATA